MAIEGPLSLALPTSSPHHPTRHHIFPFSNSLLLYLCPEFVMYFMALLHKVNHYCSKQGFESVIQ